jgi:hypothetical protein
MLFFAFTHDYSRFMHASIDGHVSMCIQSSSCELHMQQPFLPPQYLTFFLPVCHRLKQALLMFTCLFFESRFKAI